MNTERAKEVVTALTDFVNNQESCKDMSAEESKRNIEDGIVNIVLKKDLGFKIEEHKSQGLLITNDGYFLTANHCLDHNFDEGSIKTNRGKFEIWMTKRESPMYDLVLAKAHLPGECSARKYRISELKPSLDKRGISLINENGRIRDHIGLRQSSSEPSRLKNKKILLDQMEFFLPTWEFGHSGAPFIDYRGNLMGISSAAYANTESIAKISHAMEMITSYVNKLKSKYGV